VAAAAGILCPGKPPYGKQYPSEKIARAGNPSGRKKSAQVFFYGSSWQGAPSHDYRNSLSAASINAGSLGARENSEIIVSSGAWAANSIRRFVRGVRRTRRRVQKSVTAGNSEPPAPVRRPVQVSPRPDSQGGEMDADLMCAAVCKSASTSTNHRSATAPASRCEPRDLRGGARSCATGGAGRARQQRDGARVAFDLP